MDHPKIGVFNTVAVSLIFVSGTVMSMPFLHGFWMYVGVAIVWGYFSAAYIVSHAIMLVELFGMENLTTMFGFAYIFRAIGDAVGPVITGTILDQTGSFVWPGIFAGANTALGIVLYYVIGMIHQAKKSQ